jgi:hypothetical protein
MATVYLILNTFYSNTDEKNPKYPVVFIIRNNRTHSYINTSIKLEEKFRDNDKWINKNASGINKFFIRRLKEQMKDYYGNLILYVNI